jgi:hypothetical protein
MVGLNSGIIGDASKNVWIVTHIRATTPIDNSCIDVCAFQPRFEGVAIPLSGTIVKMAPNTFFRTGGSYHTDASGLAACNTTPLSAVADSPFWLTNSTTNIPAETVYVEIPINGGVPTAVDEVGFKIRSAAIYRMPSEGIVLLDSAGTIVWRSKGFPYDAANPSIYQTQFKKVS